MYKTSSDFYQDQDISDLVPRSEKAKAPYLIAMADDLIARLVTGRPELRRLRDFYEGRRSPQAFQHLTSNYGVGNPGKVPFIPIIRPRIEYLKGKYLESGIPHQIACSNSYSVGVLQQEKLDMFMEKLLTGLKADLTMRMQQAAQGQQPSPPAMLHQDELARLNEMGNNFQSSLEISAQKVMTEFITNPELRTLSNMQDHLENLLVERETAFDTRPGEPGMLAKHHVVTASQLYSDVDKKSRFSEDATCFVKRELLSVQQVLTRWGGKMTAEERRTVAGNHCLGGSWEALPLGAEKYLDFYRTNDGKENIIPSDEYRNWVAGQDGNRSNLVEVFTAQWIASNEVDLDHPEEMPDAVQALNLTAEQVAVGTAHHLTNAAPTAKRKKRTRWIQHLYETVRIGSNIYPEMGELSAAIRPVNEPWRVRPTFRRYCLDISIIEKATDAQDKSDIWHYIAENAGQLSGVKGSIIPTSDIPAELGATIQERIKAVSGYRKLGIQLINPMQQGGTKGQFSNYQSYDDSLKGDTLTGIRTFIEMYDEEVSNITGVNRQMLGAIAERDGKAVTEQAVTGGTIVTKPIFTLFDILMADALTDALNYSRQSLKAGLTGTTTTLMLGQVGRNLFTIDAEKFSLSYFRVYVRDGQDQKKQLDRMVQMATEFATSGALPPEEAIDIIFHDSATEARTHLVGKLREGSASKMQQLQQQNEQLQAELDKMKQAQQASTQVGDQVAQQEVALKARQVVVEEKTQQVDAAQGERELDLEAQQVALQRDQAVANASPSSEKVASIN